jgi:ankyrin repeat protein
MFEICEEAVSCGHFDTLKLLLWKGVDINWAPVGIETLPQYATSDLGLLDIAEYLLDLGASPDPPPISGAYFNAPIQNVAEYSSELLECLIRANVEVDVDTKPGISHGATALQRAAAAGNFQNLKILLDTRANVSDLPGKHEGSTAIEGAAEHGRLDMVRYLIEAEADIKGRTNKNYRRTVYRAWHEDTGRGSE